MIEMNEETNATFDWLLRILIFFIIHMAVPRSIFSIKCECKKKQKQKKTQKKTKKKKKCNERQTFIRSQNILRRRLYNNHVYIIIEIIYKNEKKKKKKSKALKIKKKKPTQTGNYNI